MQISKAELTPVGISLTVSRDEARRFCYSFKPGEYDIKKTRKKRSLDANAYAWKLINDISLATRVSPEEVYRNALLDADYSTLCDKYGWPPSDGMSEAVAIAVQSLQEVE